MHERLEIFQTANAMARHAGARQAVVARNIANADTPGFQAQSIAAFKDVYRADGGMALKTTRAGHIQPQGTTHLQTQAPQGTPSPNGNTVSLEEELLNSVAIGREHDRALSIYRHALTVLRTAMGRG